jgi:hypothetical protein
MYQIIYKSENLIAESESEIQIRGILESSLKNNQKDGITGLFLLIENRFVQMLEGDEATVLACMARIEKDSRHKDVKVVLKRTIESRTFPDWSMYFYKLNGDEALQKIGVEKLESLGISKWQNHFKDDLAVMLIESFARLALH